MSRFKRFTLRTGLGRQVSISKEKEGWVEEKNGVKKTSTSEYEEEKE